MVFEAEVCSGQFPKGAKKNRENVSSSSLLGRGQGEVQLAPSESGEEKGGRDANANARLALTIGGGGGGGGQEDQDVFGLTQPFTYPLSLSINICESSVHVYFLVCVYFNLSLAT